MADNRVDFSTFFNFDDQSPITDAIKLIEKLESTYEKFILTVEKQSDGLVGSMEQIKAEASSLLKSIDALNQVASKNADAYETVAKGVDDLSTSQSGLKAQMDDNSKTLSNATAQITNLKKAKEDLIKVSQTEEGSVDDLKIKLDNATKAYKAMGTATDQAIKDDQLKKIADLNNQYKTATQAVNEAKKSVDNASGSYNELSSRVANAKAALKAMEGGIGATSSEFKALQSQIKSDTDTLKNWDDSVGDNKRNVGDYKGQLGALIPGFQGVAGAVESATAAGKAFIATPLGLIIGAIALAVASLTAYFKGSVEGQDNWNKATAYASAILDLFLDGLEALGKFLFNIKDNLKPVADLLSDMWENPLKYLKQFGDFLLSQVVNRFVALGEIVEAVGKVIQSGFTDGFKDLGNAVLKLETGFDKVIDKALEFGTEAYNAAQKAAKAALEAAEAKYKIELALAEKENLIRKEKIRDIVDDAQTELKVNELLEDSKDKIAFADEDRLKKVREARALLNAQLKGDIELAGLEVDAQKLRIQAAGGVLQAGKKLSEYTNEELKNIGVKYELLEELARLEAEQIKIEADAANKRKSLTKQEIQIINEISTAYFDRIKREKQAQVEIDTYLVQSAIARNTAILADEDSSLEQRMEAIKSNANETQKLLEINYNKDLDAAKEASLAKIELNSETTQKIYSDSTKTLTEQIQAEKDAKEAALMNDSKYAQERAIYTKNATKLYDKYTDDIITNTDKQTQAANDNIFKVLDRDWKILNSNINADVSTQQDELNKAYANGTIGMREFQRERTKINGEGTRTRLTAELDYLQKVLTQTDLTEQKRAELEAKSADIRKQISQQTADQILANEQKLRAAINQLATEGLNFATTTIKAAFQANIDSLTGQLNAEQQKHDASIALVGNDAQAKAIIDQNFANKKIEIEKKIAAEKRKQAIADKVRSATEIIINTARAVVAALPIIPLAVAIGAIGALQLATVVATPIPAFAKGTKSSPEGLALVGEGGPELGIHKGKATLYDKPSLVHLKQGTEIKTASETKSLMEDAKRFGDGYMFGKKASVFEGYNLAMKDNAKRDEKLLAKAIQENKLAIVEAIQGQIKQTWDEEGYRKFTRTKNGVVERLNKKYSFDA